MTTVSGTFTGSEQQDKREKSFLFRFETTYRSSRASIRIQEAASRPQDEQPGRSHDKVKTVMYSLR